MADERPGLVFDEDADLYDRARPTYPRRLVTDLVATASLKAGDRILEIGPGTGQATLDVARLGLEVTAVEPGVSLAARLRLRARGLPVRVEVSRFEDWSPPAEPFDAVLAFKSWHWLEPQTRVTTLARVLRQGGAVATVTTSHIAGGSVDFFDLVQRCYEQWDPETPPGLRLPVADQVPEVRDELDDSPLFASISRVRYTQEITYTAAQYRDLLMTYSGHRALADARRRGLLTCVTHLIDTQFGGAVTKRYLYEVRTARRR